MRNPEYFMQVVVVGRHNTPDPFLLVIGHAIKLVTSNHASLARCAKQLADRTIHIG